ncbi:MAG: GspH/FimT family pseudopilin [Burkholderiales bacterium]
MLMTSRHDQSGVTLIELLIGLALIGILLVMAVPAYQFWIQNVQIRNAAEGVLNGLQLARAEAVRRNALVQLIFGAGSGWTMSTVVGGTEIQARSANEGSESATVTITPAGADRITFNGMGWLANNNNGSPTITRFDVAGTMVGTEIRVLRVTVGAGGVMKMCDPAVAAGDPRACP